MMNLSQINALDFKDSAALEAALTEQLQAWWTMTPEARKRDKEIGGGSYSHDTAYRRVTNILRKKARAIALEIGHNDLDLTVWIDDNEDIVVRVGHYNKEKLKEVRNRVMSMFRADPLWSGCLFGKLKVRGYEIFNMYFSDGNFDQYGYGFRIRREAK